MSLLLDVNLSPSELDSIHSLHSHHRGARTTSCVGILLQHLWDTYGSIPTNKTLLYASLMWESYWHCYEIAGWSPTGTWDFFNYKDKFLTEMKKDITSGLVNECHFFALFLASQSAKSGVPGFKKELHTYQQGMVRILKALLREDRMVVYRPLMKLWEFILSFTRRIMCRGDFSMPEYFVEDARKIESEEVQMDSPFSGNVFEHQWTFWNETECCLCEEFATIADYFRLFLVNGEACQQPFPGICTIRLKLDNMINIHDISDIFHKVSFIFCPFPQ